MLVLGVGKNTPNLRNRTKIDTLKFGSFGVQFGSLSPLFSVWCLAQFFGQKH